MLESVKIHNDHQMLVVAVLDAESIKERLKHETRPTEINGLQKQYEWTALRITNLCKKILDLDLRECYSNGVNDKIKVAQILREYERV